MLLCKQLYIPLHLVPWKDHKEQNTYSFGQNKLSNHFVSSSPCLLFWLPGKHPYLNILHWGGSRVWGGTAGKEGAGLGEAAFRGIIAVTWRIMLLLSAISSQGPDPALSFHSCCRGGMAKETSWKARNEAEVVGHCINALVLI